MSTRRNILDSIASRMADVAGIATAIPWKPTPFSTGQLPALAWRDKIERAYDEHEQLWQLTIALCGYLPNGSTADDSRDLLSRICAAIWADPYCDGQADSTLPHESAIIMQQSGDTIAACTVTIQVFYHLSGSGDATETFRLQDEQSNNLTDESGDTITW